MRLIDADALKKVAEDHGFWFADFQAIDNAPTIDAVPVVRCCECKYGSSCGDEIACYHPEYELEEGVRSYPQDFFCSYGERKEGANHE